MVPGVSETPHSPILSYSYSNKKRGPFAFTYFTSNSLKVPCTIQSKSVLNYATFALRL